MNLEKATRLQRDWVQTRVRKRLLLRGLPQECVIRSLLILLLNMQYKLVSRLDSTIGLDEKRGNDKIYGELSRQQLQLMHSYRIQKVNLYDDLHRLSSRHSKILQRAHGDSLTQQTDPFRQQITSYLSRFRERPALSNLLLGEGKSDLPTLYSKARKYSVLTLKRNPHRSFRQNSTGRAAEVLPALQQLYL